MMGMKWVGISDENEVLRWETEAHVWGTVNCRTIIVGLRFIEKSRE